MSTCTNEYFLGLRQITPAEAHSGTPAPARLLEMIAPAGFETYFVELAEAGDPGRRQELAAIWGDLSIELACRAQFPVQPEVYLVNGKCSLYIKQRSHPFRGGIDHWDAAVTVGFARDPFPSCEGLNSR